jgi:uncharacterized protein
MPVIKAEFEIDRQPDMVWERLKDVELVAECMPGVELNGRTGPNRFAGTMKTRIGAISSSFEGEAQVVERDDASRTGRIEAKGVDRKGGSRASAEVTYAVSDSSQGSMVSVTADLRLQGALAQFGRTGLLQDITDQLVGELAGTLRRRLAARTEEEEAAAVRAEAVRPLRLLLLAIWGRIRRLFARAS